jgi:hypothetical protein
MMPKGCLFKAAVIGLLPLTLLTGWLFWTVYIDIRDYEQKIDQFQAELEQQFAAWRAQRIDDYAVTYHTTEYGYVNAGCGTMTLTIEDNILTDIPCNAPSYYGYYNIHALRSMDEQFRWLIQNGVDFYDDNLEITYHPTLHYIQKIVIHSDFGSSITIEYTNLEQLND